MKWEEVIDRTDLGEPYASMDFLEIDEICRIESYFKGRQIAFKKCIDDIDDMEKTYPEICLILGKEKARKLAKTFSGETVYFPEMKRACSGKVRQLILEQFDGNNYSEIARKYGYSERHIRKIVKKGIAQKNIYENQISLFDIPKKF